MIDSPPSRLNGFSRAARPTVLLITLSLVACQSQRPSADSVTYANQLAPLLSENSLLAERLLHTAANAQDASLEQDESPDPTAIASSWREQIVPLAEHVARQAQLVVPPPTWLEEHEELSGIWTSRAEGYRSIADGLTDGTEARFKRGRALADRAKLNEEEWFQKANERLASERISLDQFP